MSGGEPRARDGPARPAAPRQHPAPHDSHVLPKQAGPEPHCCRCGCHVIGRPARKRRAADCAKSTAQSWRAACFSSAARARKYCSNNDDVIDQQVCSSCADRQVDRQFGRKTHTASSKAAARLIYDATGRSRCRTLLPCPLQRLPHGIGGALRSMMNTLHANTLHANPGGSHTHDELEQRSRELDRTASRSERPA